MNLPHPNLGLLCNLRHPAAAVTERLFWDCFLIVLQLRVALGRTTNAHLQKHGGCTKLTAKPEIQMPISIQAVDLLPFLRELSHHLLLRGN